MSYNNGKRHVSNEEFEAAMKNKDNANLIRSISKRFYPLIDHEDLRSACHLGLWRALQYHDPKFGQKFTTTLFRFVRWECQKELRRQGLAKKRFVQFPQADYSSYDTAEEDGRLLDFERRDELEHVKSRMKKLSGEHRRLVEMRYIKGMSTEDIGEVQGYSKETARKRLMEAVNVLREVCND